MGPRLKSPSGNVHHPREPLEQRRDELAEGHQVVLVEPVGLRRRASGRSRSWCSPRRSCPAGCRRARPARPSRSAGAWHRNSRRAIAAAARGWRFRAAPPARPCSPASAGRTTPARSECRCPPRTSRPGGYCPGATRPEGAAASFRSRAAPTRCCRRRAAPPRPPWPASSARSAVFRAAPSSESANASSAAAKPMPCTPTQGASTDSGPSTCA